LDLLHPKQPCVESPGAIFLACRHRELDVINVGKRSYSG
jgi:hypothetical protein